MTLSLDGLDRHGDLAVGDDAAAAATPRTDADDTPGAALLVSRCSTKLSTLHRVSTRPARS
jgi:hypothetical protein